jgi:hypothetical protein
MIICQRIFVREKKLQSQKTDKSHEKIVSSVLPQCLKTVPNFLLADKEEEEI